MFDPRSYREACRELTAPEDKIEEIIVMAENTSRRKVRPMRAALIAAAVAAVMVAGVAAANPEGVREIIYSITSAVEVDDYRTDLTTEDGEEVAVYSIPQAGVENRQYLDFITQGRAGSIPRAGVENRDGRAILVIDGKDAADMTEELNAEGRYDYECTIEGSRLTVTVEGAADQWTAEVSICDPDGLVYTFSSDSEGGAGSIPGAVVPGNDGSCTVSSFPYDVESAGGD